jgi:hypothetical protein
VADLVHRSSRTVDQRPAVVHDRLMELGARLSDELPPIQPGTQAASILGVTGRVPIEIRDLGAGRIEIRTMAGRIRGEAAADLQPVDTDRTALALSIAIKPQGFAASMMLGAGVQMAGGRQKLVDSLDRVLDDLVVELAKPDGEWDATSWTPPGLNLGG